MEKKTTLEYQKLRKGEKRRINLILPKGLLDNFEGLCFYNDENITQGIKRLIKEELKENSNIVEII